MPVVGRKPTKWVVGVMATLVTVNYRTTVVKSIDDFEKHYVIDYERGNPLVSSSNLLLSTNRTTIDTRQ